MYAGCRMYQHRISSQKNIKNRAATPMVDDTAQNMKQMKYEIASCYCKDEKSAHFIHKGGLVMPTKSHSGAQYTRKTQKPGGHRFALQPQL